MIMKYILYCILEIIFTIIAYITNPIVILFANEVGELPHLFRWWANWDDGLDVEWMVTEHQVPRFAEYDFCRHYKYYTEWEAEKITGRHCGFVILLDPHFTLWERFQRYICRLTWIYRNCGYGFSYYVTGVDVDGADIVKTEDISTEHYRFQVYYTDYAWMIRYDKPWCKWFRWRIFLGWKMQGVDSTETQRCMLALFISPFRKVTSTL